MYIYGVIERDVVPCILGLHRILSLFGLHNYTDALNYICYQLSREESVSIIPQVLRQTIHLHRIGKAEWLS